MYFNMNVIIKKQNEALKGHRTEEVRENVYVCVTAYRDGFYLL